MVSQSSGQSCFVGSIRLVNPPPDLSGLKLTLPALTEVRAARRNYESLQTKQKESSELFVDCREESAFLRRLCLQLLLC